MSDPVSARVAYDAWASQYDHDDNLTRDLDAALLRAAALPLAGASIVELGAGTGKNTEYLAREAREVVALDLSPAMLQRARERVMVANVRFVEHDLRNPWPIPSGEADLVVGNLVLEHIADLSPIFVEARRVLKASGLLYLSELHPYRQLRGAAARFQSADGEQRVEAYLHLTEDYVRAAFAAGFTLASLCEPNHPADGEPRIPRILELVFRCPEGRASAI